MRRALRIAGIAAWLWLCIAVGTMLFCCASLQNKRDVSVSPEQFHDYYLQLERRLDIYFAQQGRPTPIIWDEARLEAALRWIEFDPEPGTTCYFDRNRTISIGADKWASGCVPHEMGHAALKFIGNRCWDDFEEGTCY